MKQAGPLLLSVVLAGWLACAENVGDTETAANDEYLRGRFLRGRPCLPLAPPRSKENASIHCDNRLP